MSGLERLTAASLGETLAFLARRPIENLYLTWLLESGVAERSTGTVVVWRGADRAIAAVLFAGPQTVVSAWSAPDAAMLEALAGLITRASSGTMFGPKGSVDALWRRVRETFGTGAIVRDVQPLYALDRATHAEASDDVCVVRATRADLDELVPHAAAMIAGETGVDPRISGANFRGRCGRIVDAGWWWLFRAGGELAFTCHVGAATQTIAAVQGVWTPPVMRGHGHATRALAAVCDRLLADYATISLHVNDFNASAIALYERVGFRRIGTFATVLTGR